MTTMHPDLESRLQLALQAAREAGRHTLQYFQRDDLEVERKDDASPVTVADREAEQLLRRAIHKHFPNDGIVGEEFGEQPGENAYRWILDPIDGTKSFISGVPLYGTMVGVEHEARPLIGVVFIPGLNELIYAAKGHGAWRAKGDAEPREARVSDRRSLAEGLFVTSQVDSFAKRDAAQAFLDLQAAASITRTWGDCYGYLLVATGRAEAMVDPEMSIWDAAALAPILEEAGGAFTDWKGEPTIHSGEGIGANPHVLEEVLQITRQFVK